MKKSYLMIAAAAALFAACSSNDTLREINEENLIGFSTVHQKATKATENSGEDYTWSLSNHHTTFKVWGYKNTSATAVFNGEEVRWDTSVDPDAWVYTNNRYWDKAATTYQFYACAPYGVTATPFTFNGVTDVASQGSGYFTIETAYTKVGENVSPKNSTTAVESWKARNPETDVDLMIAAPATYTGGALTTAYTGKVTLNFIHILSRLNITVKTADGFYPTVETGDKIKVTNITIGHMNNSGTFNENTTLGDGVLAGGTSARWTATGNHDFSYDINYDATQTANYVIETLVMPQTAGVEEITLNGTKVTTDAETMPFLKIAYSIYNNAENAHEDYVSYYNLASLFGKTGAETLAFNEGWQNTLNITISPDQIHFDGKVAVWDDATPAGAVTVK